MKKKLIEVALPLEAINKASAREKSIRHGHPSTLHLWWARRPLAACRAVLFASLVDDPSSHPDRFPTEEAQEKERQRLFSLIEELVQWENSNNEEVLARARKEILDSTDGNPPPVYDPFCGGGSIPLEAQRLGLKAYASDLNPVAVLITKAMIEIPPKFKDRPPVHPNQEPELIAKKWKGAEGLAEDIRYYGQWMRDEAFRRIGHLYPKVQLPEDQGGGEATVIAWLWARTVICPNPACGARMPLIRSFELCRKNERRVWVQPEIDRSKVPASVRFTVRRNGRTPTGTVSRQGAICLLCDTPVPFAYVRNQGKAGGLEPRLMAIVAEGPSGRLYLPPDDNHELIASKATGGWFPDGEISHWPGRTNVVEYGMITFGSLFTQRQLVALTTISDLVREARDRIKTDGLRAGLSNEEEGLDLGGTGARAYAEAVAAYLSIGVSRMADINNTACRWEISKTQVRNLFTRQAIPMVWDYAENNVFNEAAGDYFVSLKSLVKTLYRLPSEAPAIAFQQDSTRIKNPSPSSIMISTDPPYYDNIAYADLSDFFYIWLRRSLQGTFSGLFDTMLVPKNQELVASPYRFGGNKQEAKSFFERGMLGTFLRIQELHEADSPLTVYYAFKQAESEEQGENGHASVASTGWETMLEALLKSGFGILGTWPIRTELLNRSLGLGSNALASSIVLSCRKRPEHGAVITRRDFLQELKKELPRALRTLQKLSIAPVDLAQSSIGPGMSVFSRYVKILEADGSAMPVRMALGLINQVLDEVLAEQEGDFDPETRFAVSWFQQFGMKEGPFGEAETLSKAKVVSVAGLQEAGILTARRGKVQLIPRKDLPEDWDPVRDSRLTVWEITQHLVRVLLDAGEQAAGLLFNAVGARGEVARDLAYRLYSICERKGWAQEAIAYNSLIIAWPELSSLAVSAAQSGAQKDLPL